MVVRRLWTRALCLLPLCFLVLFFFLAHAFLQQFFVFPNEDFQKHVENSAHRPTTRSFYIPGHLVSNRDACPEKGANIQLMIMVVSAPKHLDHRQAIRRTWASLHLKNLSILFIVGRTGDRKLDRYILKEQKQHTDMVVGKFKEAYRNLTLKSISMLQWFTRYCSKARYLAKVDDDVFLNVPNLLQLTRQGTGNTLYGQVHKFVKPVRDEHDKFFVSYWTYALKYYPLYLAGPCYLIPGNLVKDLYMKSLDTAFLMFEDVFITGIIAEILEISRQDHPQFFNSDYSWSSDCEVNNCISVHLKNHTKQYELWKASNNGLQCGVQSSSFPAFNLKNSFSFFHSFNIINSSNNILGIF